MGEMAKPVIGLLGVQVQLEAPQKIGDDVLGGRLIDFPTFRHESDRRRRPRSKKLIAETITRAYWFTSPPSRSPSFKPCNSDSKAGNRRGQSCVNLLNTMRLRCGETPSSTVDMTSAFPPPSGPPACHSRSQTQTQRA